MRAFTQLLTQLDRTTRTSEKRAALELYFSSVESADAAWAVALLTGRRMKRVVSTRVLRELIGQVADIPDWLLGECYSQVGDLSETIALLLPEHDRSCGLPLHRVMEEWISPLAAADSDRKRQLLLAFWEELNTDQRFVFHKLISTNFRVGVQKRQVIRALAGVTGLDHGIIAHRLAGHFEPTVAAFEALIAQDDEQSDHARPYPFCLAPSVSLTVSGDTELLERLGPVGDWQVEHKWDGIRAQIIKRSGATMIWSRGDDLVTEQFPMLASAACSLPDGAVLDGELVEWMPDGDAGHVLPFADLQRRLGRKPARAAQMPLFSQQGVAFLAYDLLEAGGEDVRERSTSARRALLEEIVRGADELRIRLSPVLAPRDWSEAGAIREDARTVGAEGLMLKRASAKYCVGRQPGPGPSAVWLKWKCDPYSVDAVLTHAQHGHGRRAGLYTDYTFGLWDRSSGSEVLVTFARAYSGLTQEEITRVDAFVREHTIARAGPVRRVEPELVFEIAFEGIQESRRHQAGLAVRFPRIARWRSDKSADEADTLQDLIRLKERGVELR